MQTRLTRELLDTPAGAEADRILRSCTHCGFCLATCPTYQELGDELDSPRGRIYLVKQLLEGSPAGEATRRHLDRCLTCHACEATCPSGVRYTRLADLGRELIERRAPRPPGERILRRLLRMVLPRRRLFAALLVPGRLLRPALPRRLRESVPVRRRPAPRWPAGDAGRSRRVLMLEGCVQPALAPAINPRTARLLQAAGFAVIRTPSAGCCGAIDQHLAAPDAARARARRNIDAWWPKVEAGVDAIVVNASGCGAHLLDYARLLADDPVYRSRAERVATLVREPVELLSDTDLPLAAAAAVPRRIVFQSPCTLQHAMGLGGRIEALLTRLGYELASSPEGHLCCGSAGTYSVLEPALSRRLRARKLGNLLSDAPEAVVTANIGCLNHLAAGSPLPVYHWVELVDPAPAAA
ncbi:MAG TPA: glycolate oxidase subunit GlcF [Gammaproteobacteria bacterium]|nr:glycolate oxidase subunit GlcF [Gammaproteobacteria bacterium]